MENNIMMNALWKQYTMKLELKIHKSSCWISSKLYLGTSLYIINYNLVKLIVILLYLVKFSCIFQW
jgi:hypothetical protein